MHLKKVKWTGPWLPPRLFIKRPVVVPGAWEGKCSPVSHPGFAVTATTVSPCKHSCLKGSGVFRDSSVGVFTVKPSVNWMWLNDFSHLRHSCSVDKSRMCCLQPLESTAPRVQGKIKLKCQWVTWLPEGVHEYMEVFWAEVGWRNWGWNIDVSKII